MKLELFENHGSQDRLHWSEANELFWNGFLDQWLEEVWPMYEKRGFSKDAALMHFQLNEVASRLDHIEHQLDNDSSL